MMDATTLAALTQKIAQLLQLRGYRLATAESCTGGWIAKCCTDLAGSSAWFDCGYVTYSNNAKMRMLGVRAETLEQHGAVSEAVVQEMALAALQRGQVDMAIAVSGIAGPDGGSASKPVGTVYLAWAIEGRVAVRREIFSGNRDEIRMETVAVALQGVLDMLAVAEKHKL